MDIVGVILGIFKGLIEKAIESLLKPLFGLIEIVALSPESLGQMPFIEPLYEVTCAIGVGVLILVTSWQAFKAMNVGLGFEGDEPQKIAVKAFVAGFLVFYIKEIMMLAIEIASGMIEFIFESAGVAINAVGLFDVVFGMFTFNIVYLILGIVFVFKILGLAFRMFERLAMCALLMVCSPIAVATMVAKPTEGFWQGFIKLFIGNIVIQITQSICVVAIVSTLGMVSIDGQIDGGMEASTFFYILLTIAIMTILGKLEDIVKDISMSVGIGRDMQGALGKIQGAAYTMTTVQGIGRAIGK